MPAMIRHHRAVAADAMADTAPKPGQGALKAKVMGGADVDALVDPLDAAQAGINLHRWPDWAREDQQEPPGDWTSWLLMGGRGAGKTRAGAEWVRARVMAGARHIALVAETYEDAREVMIEGESGLKAIGPPSQRPVYEASRHRLVWPNGAAAHVFSANQAEGLRGYQHEIAWSDELAKWPDAEVVWSNLQFGLRLGSRPRQVVTTTPRPTPLLKSLLARDGVVVSRASTEANQNLPAAFLDEVTRTYAGTVLGRQELGGELIEDRAGALWSWAMIEASRVSSAPALDRIVVAVDPPATAGGDECGLIVAGVAGEGDAKRAYVLADASAGGLSPAGWGGRAATLYQDYRADRIVAEVNQGGDMVETIVRQADPAVSYRGVHATRAKRLRAEPVAALYERGLVHHVGAFGALEEQMTQFVGAAGGSPDRLDALVWALTDLMLGPNAARPSIRTL